MQRYGAHKHPRTPVHDTISPNVGAHWERRSRSFYVREAIQLHLGDLEERYWEDQVIQEWENSDQSTRPAVELWSELGL